MGHREDVWTNPPFQQITLGALAWAMGNVEADVTPNMAKVTPEGGRAANQTGATAPRQEPAPVGR